MTIRKKLVAVLVIAAAAPVVLSGALAYRIADRALSSSVAALHTRSALGEAEFAGSYVQSFGDEMSLALSYEDPSRLPAAGAQEFVTRLYLRRDRVSVAALLDRAGTVQNTVFVDDPEGFARQEPQFRRHATVAAAEAAELFERAQALLRAAAPGARFAISAPYRPRVRGGTAIAVVAFAPPGRTMSLAAELMLDDVAAHLGRSAQGTRAFLLDADGRLFLSGGGDERRSDEPVPAAFAAMASRQEGISEFSLDGVAYQAAHSRVPSLGWTAVVARPRAEAVAPLNDLFRSTGLALLAALVLVAAIAPFASRTLARPIAALVEGAQEFTRGNFAHRIRLPRQDELGRLADTFNEMGQSIEEANRKLVRFNEELQAQVDERTRELRLAQQQLLRSQRLAAVGDLSAGLAHEVNNPLSTIVGNAQLLLLELPEKDGARPMLNDVLEQALRISDIVRDLQALSEAQRGGLSPVDLHDVIERAVESARSSGIVDFDVARRLGAPQATVLGDDAALREVLGHLLSNAANAVRGRERPDVAIATTLVEHEAIMVEVSDNGRGIPKENLERIFNPFFTTKQSWTGRGLALAICHRIVENHGGKISIRSEEGVGTTVTVVFPAAPPKPHLR